MYDRASFVEAGVSLSQGFALYPAVASIEDVFLNVKGHQDSRAQSIQHQFTDRQRFLAGMLLGKKCS